MRTNPDHLYAEAIFDVDPLLLSRLEDLKRIVPGHLHRSIASELFTESWRLLYIGHEVDYVARYISAKALIHTLLPGFDSFLFTKLQWDIDTISETLKDALAEATDDKIDSTLRSFLFDSISDIAHSYSGKHNLCAVDEESFQQDMWFVDALCKQPRAGATSPGKSRLLLYPPEMHSDHCMLTAIFAVLLSPSYGATPGLPFLTGLCHHLHNALVPDSGFAGEMALGNMLPKLLHESVYLALKRIDATLQLRIQEALANHENLDNAEGKASTAADVIDRVLDIDWRIRAASVSETSIFQDLDLIHNGPVKAFQEQALHYFGVRK